MDEMRRQGVKRAWIVVYTGGSDSPQQWTIDEEAYYKEYEREGSQIVDPLWLRRIKKGGLAHTLDEVALHRAVHSPWTKHDTMLIPVDLLDSEKIPPESYQQENDEILQVAAQVRPESDIGQDLQSGVHGDGIHYLWMDKMRNAGARRAVAILDISFHDDGTPNKIRVAAIHYYGAYDSDESLIKDLNFLALVKGNALDHDLREIAVERASRGFWFDVPRPRPQPFVGGTAVEFLDNGWLPTFDQGHPMFTTGRPDQTGW